MPSCPGRIFVNRILSVIIIQGHQGPRERVLMKLWTGPHSVYNHCRRFNRPSLGQSQSQLGWTNPKNRAKQCINYFSEKICLIALDLGTILRLNYMVKWEYETNQKEDTLLFHQYSMQYKMHGAMLMMVRSTKWWLNQGCAHPQNQVCLALGPHLSPLTHHSGSLNTIWFTLVLHLPIKQHSVPVEILKSVLQQHHTLP